MRRFVLRLLGAIALTAIVAAVLAAIPAFPTAEKEFEIKDADVSVKLQRDGSLVVRESLPFHFTGSFQGAYRDIPLNPPARITGASVSDRIEGRYRPGGNIVLGSTDIPGAFGAQDRGGSFRVVWHYRQDGGVRTFDVAYRVEDAVTVHDDVVDVSWVVWGDQWDFWLDDLTASISAVSGVAPEQAWVREIDFPDPDEDGDPESSRDLGADPTIADGAATVTIDRVPEGRAVGMRAVFPREAIESTAGAVATGEDGRAEIEDEERELDDDYGLIARAENFAADNQVLIALLTSVLALLGTVILCLRAREITTGVPEYLPEPPEDVPPAVAYAVAEEGDYDDRLVLATLMDLVDRDYYEARAAQGDELDLEVHRLGERGERRSALEDFEISVLDFFDELIGEDWVAIGAMKDRVPEHSSTWRDRWEAMNGHLEEAEDGEIGWDLDLRGARRRIALAVLVLLGLLTVLVWMRTHLVLVPVTALVGTLALTFVPPANWLRRLDPEARARNERWSAFKRWTEDFPRLSDDPPATLKLWRRILVYAVAFGTAERIVKSGRIPAPVVEEASSSGAWTTYAAGSGFGHSFNGFSSGFASQVAPESSSSSGGFSGGGGGGGFSGGGGGGAW